mgnify:CR=1 FL=1
MANNLLNNIDNKTIINYINLYNDFNDLSLFKYLSRSLNIHKERINIKKIENLDLSNNLDFNDVIGVNDYFILINETNNDIFIDKFLDNSLNNNINNRIICTSYNNLIINEPTKLNLSNDVSKNFVNLNKNNIKYIILEDLCKSNKILNNPKQLFENYDTINERKNNIFILNDENIINNNDCDYFVKLLNTHIENKEYNIEKWGSGSNVNCLFMHVENIKNVEVKKKVDNKIFQIVNKVINYLYKEYDILCRGDSGYCLRKIYGCTREHKDGVLSKTNDSSKIVYKNQIRNMSIIIALNDDYESGEFCFPRQNFKIKLKKGEIIVFPPYWTHPHFVREPTNNTYRYTINTWLYE